MTIVILIIGALFVPHLIGASHPAPTPNSNRPPDAGGCRGWDYDSVKLPPLDELSVESGDSTTTPAPFTVSFAPAVVPVRTVAAANEPMMSLS